MKFFGIFLFLSCLLLTAQATALGGETPPIWLRQAASASVPSYDKEVPAVVLYNESIVTLGNDGLLITTENYAIRILNREGNQHAIARALYLVSAGRVREIEGWLIRPGGTVTYYDKKKVLDIISDPDDVYNEYRLKVIDASREAGEGMVFGYTVTSEEKPLYFQEKWFSQDRLPSLMSRYTLNLPANWKATSITFNHPPVTPQVNGSSYTWEFRNLPFIKKEPKSPSVVNIIPWIAINYMPEDVSQAGYKVFSDWREVSRWTTTLYDPQVIIDDSVAAKAQELTANAKTEFEKIREIANFVQNLQYISIDIGVGSGNGYRPRPSNLVLNRGYGDCKDKANLMRAMLKVLKIEAYPIAIFSGDPTFVRQEWASPAQFNHCIIAIKVSDSTNAPSLITHPMLGRLLIFDATDPYTLLGDLPDSLQGSFGLLIAGDNGGLAKMPILPAEANLLIRNIEARLTAEGSLNGKISEKSVGQASSMERALFRMLSADDYRKMLENWLTSGSSGSQLIKFTSNDKRETADFNLDVEFFSPRYGQIMQNRLLIFNPVIVNRRNALSLMDNSRSHPIILNSEAIKETIIFNLPTEFEVDEIPDAVNLETSFGKYTTSYEVKDGKLYFSRTLVMNRSTLPVEKYNTVRDFFSKIRQAEQSSVVLIKK
jgi:hypothetical protein